MVRVFQRHCSFSSNSAGKERPDVIRKYRREYADMKIVQNSADKGSKK